MLWVYRRSGVLDRGGSAMPCGGAHAGIAMPPFKDLRKNDYVEGRRASDHRGGAVARD